MSLWGCGEPWELCSITVQRSILGIYLINFDQITLVGLLNVIISWKATRTPLFFVQKMTEDPKEERMVTLQCLENANNLTGSLASSNAACSVH
jgi:hypothetical protein